MDILTFIRFEDDQGKIHYGEASPKQLSGTLVNETVRLLNGDPFNGFKHSGATGKVAKVVCPLASTPIIICVGLNYRAHAEEASLDIAPYPVVFTKPSTALNDTTSMLDYEGELVVVLGKDAKNVSEEDALKYVLGYTIGNDISARNFQLPAVSGGQFSYAKSFDGFAPIGPAIATTKAISDPQALRYFCRVNGETRQETSTSDMIWTVSQIIHHLSRGTTLKRGTIIMTGTPSGVGFCMSPQAFLNDGDSVEVELGGFGTMKNKIVFG